ncbi:uncharacterized protein si:busm1-163l24.3 isoform X2 [Synchiropus splendidus]|nr:uncharacterized protein si:busm1-163l24.3 isoform X2 [Synchiropus splendidus]XP_053708407.1 uncharacterized protein si:busm1-163l24.3 isoform X2 [Synchiropus splendidus]XP_053708408.1 uncharacterized protein si:busm1-163l24.3 isoform X2 [Synchiropus splendidus]XP_053708409.1 uncharacterized protein si:busm1-163l24.3 isoform X2 [Synchiropus splendidus]XP_053708410.1 uncharacterized protein si:busm1-163l24.3 isoform X2 [Synchiropus splendidus]
MEPDRTVRVRGLPTDIGDDRIKDKLFIHFLRSRNGGGEIDHVSLDKKEPGSALITFEDSLVARRITQLHWHHLDVDGRKFELTVSEHCGRLDPDQVILNVSATVDFSQLPGGKAVLTSLHQKYPDVQTIYDPLTTTCIVCGAYSKVQLVLSHLLSLSHSNSSQTRQKAEFPKPQEHSFKEHTEKRRREHNSRTSDERDKSTQSDVVAQKAAGGLSSLVEDYSLIVDSDIFQYLQKRCQDRYHQILSQYGVEVVDVSNQGLTTLFLHIAVPDQGQEKDRIQMAQDAVSELYQENESKIRKDQLCKSILSPKGGLKKALKNISMKFPRILLNEDDVNVYIIGNRSDVCDAKQILLLDQGEDGAFLPDVNTESSTPNMVDTDLLRLSSPTAKSLNDRKGQSGEDERRTDSKYKLASRFRDSGLSTLSSLPVECSFLGRQQTSSTPKGTKAIPVNDSGEFRPTVKRTSSFSGISQRKSKVPAIQDDSALLVAKSKVQMSSLSGQKDALRREAYHEEIEIPTVLWEYIKEAYHSEVDDMTFEVQVKESISQNGSDANLIIKGASEAKVILCHSALQTLIDNVRPDFSHLEIHLSELGISDPADETLYACCEEVRRHFAKVIVRILKKSLLLLGPKKLCSQVGASLQEVFRGCCSKAGEDFLSSGFNGKRMVTDLDGSPSTTHLRSASGGMQPHFGSEMQFSVRKDPVKEKVTSFGTSEQRIFIQPYPPTTEVTNEFKGSKLNRDARSPKVEGTSPLAEEGGHNLQGNFDSSLAQGDQVHICVCGKTETPMTRTDCGTTMCSRCLETVHVYCRVCQDTERSTQQGIRGKMSHCKLNVSIPGSQDSAIKITYLIPNGIQGDSHPSPGRPFRGGVFEAFLPDCSKTRKLLPRLEEAFKLGFTFTVTNKDMGAKVMWASIPHKTSLQGGKSGKGYPDSSYLNRLSTVLTSLGIKE